MLTFTEMREHLRATWPDESDKVRTIAARYYIGAETDADLETISTPLPFYLDYPPAPAIISKADVHHIKYMR